MRVLVAIANHGTKNTEFLRRLLDTYRSMTHQVDVIVLSDTPKDLGDDVEVVVGAPTADPRSLPFAHQPIFADRIDQYDLFIYSEDDTLVTQRNLDAFCEVNDQLPAEMVPGFFRHEVRPSGAWSYSSFHTVYHWEPDSLRRLGDLEIATFSNAHSAVYVVTAAQLKIAIASGGYLVPPHSGEYTQMVSAATDIYTQCGLERVMCLTRIDDFILHHLPNIYLDRLGIDDHDFRLQLDALRQVERGTLDGRRLLTSETQMPTAKWHRRYFDVNPLPGILTRTETIVGSVLSIGCTTGDQELRTFPCAATITAVPMDDVVGSIARDRGLETLCPDLDEALASLDGRRFDVIWMDDLLHRLPNPPARLSQLRQHLAPGGTVLATAPNLRQHVVKRRLGKTARPVPDRRGSFATHGVHYTNETALKSWFTTAGLDVHRIDAVLTERQTLGGPRRAPGFLRRITAETLLATAGPPLAAPTAESRSLARSSS